MCKQRIIDLKLKLYAINAYEVAKETGMGGRINTIMQTCFFYLSSILPQDEAIARHQEGHREDLRQAGREGRADELQRRGPRRGCSSRDRGADRGRPATW